MQPQRFGSAGSARGPRNHRKAPGSPTRPCPPRQADGTRPPGSRATVAASAAPCHPPGAVQRDRPGCLCAVAHHPPAPLAMELLRALGVIDRTPPPPPPLTGGRSRIPRPGPAERPRRPGGAQRMDTWPGWLPVVHGCRRAVCGSPATTRRVPVEMTARFADLVAPAARPPRFDVQSSPPPVPHPPAAPGRRPRDGTQPKNRGWVLSGCHVGRIRGQMGEQRPPDRGLRRVVQSAGPCRQSPGATGIPG